MCGYKRGKMFTSRWWQWWPGVRCGGGYLAVAGLSTVLSGSGKKRISRKIIQSALL